MSRINGNRDPITHSGAMTMLLLANIWTLYAFIVTDHSKLFGFLIIIPIWIFVGIKYSSDKQVNKILEKYKNESPKSSKRGNIIVFSYIILSFVLFIISMNYSHNQLYLE
jgi:hypothetical protein